MSVTDRSPRRRYPRCAKGGHEKPLDTHYVCEDHAGMGGYTNCAVCGDGISDPRCYVCVLCLVGSSRSLSER